MTDLSYDLGELAAGAGTIHSLSGEAAMLAAPLSETVESTAMCWGTDAPGRAFAAVYLDPATEAMTAVLQAGEQLQAIADNITRMREIYLEGERTGVDLSRELRP